MILLIMVMLANVDVYNKQLFYQKFLMLTKGAFAIGSKTKSNHYSCEAKTTHTHHYLYSWNEQFFSMTKKSSIWFWFKQNLKQNLKYSK